MEELKPKNKYYPEFRDVCDESLLELMKTYSQIYIKLSPTKDPIRPNPPVSIVLSKRDVLRLIGELMSWCETGDFMVPKRPLYKYVAVFHPNCFPMEIKEITALSLADATRMAQEMATETYKCLGVLNAAPVGEELCIK